MGSSGEGAMNHHVLHTFSSVLAWSYLVRHGFTSAYEGRASLALDLALVLLGGLLAFLLFSGTGE
jgi:hypothetical protein